VFAAVTLDLSERTLVRDTRRAGNRANACKASAALRVQEHERLTRVGPKERRHIISTVIESLQERPPNLPGTHYVDNRFYTDQGIFAEERERVFRRVWNFVCHESEVRTPGDFRVVNVAGFPILLARGQEGVLRAFYNICRHRAAPVARQECGNAKAFQCFYHLWTYGLDGQLIGVTRPRGGAIPLSSHVMPRVVSG